MKQRLARSTPFLIASLLFVSALSFLGYQSYRTNDGHLVYTLDDPYVHMAIAKNIVLHGVFGVTRYEFSASTSSPLWTILLAAGYKAFGVVDWLPGVLAAVFALAALYVTNSLCQRFALNALARTIVCCGVLYFAPLIPLVSTGMEHAMHLFFVLLLILLMVRFIESPSRGALGLFCIVGALATSTRYESLFVIAPLAFFLLIQRHWLAAVALSVSSLISVIAYGIFSVLNGGYFLPNPLMLKGHFHEVSGFRSLVEFLGYYGFSKLTVTAHLYSACILLLLGAYLVRKQGQPVILIALCLSCSILLHLQFADVGWFYRYEAYLVGASMPVLGGLYLGAARIPRRTLVLRSQLPEVALFACGVLLLWPMQQRARESLRDVVRASHHIYSQQYQMGRFLGAMYEPGVRVAVNDLGAVTYYADPDVVDLWGLGTIDVIRAKRCETYDSCAIGRLLHTRGTEVVMIYRNWFENLLPGDLVAVGGWSTTNNYFGKTVTFFGTSRRNAQLLRNRLWRYRPRLPKSVEVTDYEITEQERSDDK